MPLEKQVAREAWSSAFIQRLRKRLGELLRQGKNEEWWQKCCGFIDLSMEEFMDIQRRLLLEQLELLNRCELGKKVMRGAKPRSVEEFREQVPVTTYRSI